MIYLNLKDIQAKTCISIEKNEWVKAITSQVMKAAEAGETRVDIALSGTPAESLGDDYMMLHNFFLMRGFALNENVQGIMTVIWDPEHLKIINATDRIDADLKLLVEAVCRTAKILASGNEEERKNIAEDIQTLIDSMPTDLYAELKL